MQINLYLKDGFSAIRLYIINIIWKTKNKNVRWLTAGFVQGFNRYFVYSVLFEIFSTKEIFKTYVQWRLKYTTMKKKILEISCFLKHFLVACIYFHSSIEMLEVIK